LFCPTGNNNYLVELQAGIVMDVQVTPESRSHEAKSTRTMIERVEQKPGMKSSRFVRVFPAAGAAFSRT
jgi:hypothetical protein